MSEKSSEIAYVLTRQQLQAVINEKLGNTLYWLTKVYRPRPEDDESERTLLEIMAELQSMQRSVNRTFCYGSEATAQTGVEDGHEA